MVYIGQHTITKIAMVLILNLIIAMALSITETNISIENIINNKMGTLEINTERLQQDIGTNDSQGNPSSSTMFKDTSEGDNFIEGLLNAGNVIGSMWGYLISAIIPIETIFTIIKYSTGNIINKIIGWMLVLILFSINLSMWLRIYDKFIVKRPD